MANESQNSRSEPLTFLDLLTQRATAVLNTFDSPGGEVLRAAFEMWIDEATRKLRKEKDTAELYRLQGQLEILHRLRGMRSEVSERRRLEANRTPANVSR